MYPNKGEPRGRLSESKLKETLMKRFFVKILLILVSMVIAPFNAFAQQGGSAALYNGIWEGYWTSDDGLRYRAGMQLSTTAIGGVEGQINWT